MIDSRIPGRFAKEIYSGCGPTTLGSGNNVLRAEPTLHLTGQSRINKGSLAHHELNRVAATFIVFRL